MRVTLQPITLSQFKALVKRFGYDCVYDVFPALQFEKDGSVPPGYPKDVCDLWPPVLTCRHPDWSSERYPNEEVYDSSEVLEFVVDQIIGNVSADRTAVSVEIRAILKPSIADAAADAKKFASRDPVRKRKAP